MTEPVFNAQLAQSDPDRRLAALFATPEVRRRLLALYAFNQEIGKIAEATSQSLIGEMKLTWWRDAVSDLYAPAPTVRRHDTIEGLAGLTGLVTRDELLGLIDARFDDIAARPYASLEEIVDYVDATSGALMRLALRLAEAGLDPDRLDAAARAWGLTGLLRAFPVRAQIGRAPVGADALAAAGVTPAMLAQRLGGEKVARAVEPVRAAARAACAAFAEAGPLPAPAVPAIGYAVLACGYLDRLPEDPYRPGPDQPLIARQLRLTWLSLTGR